ncbi:MAG: hypothetical protein JWL76_1104 [Thermoleophilia bacterium]|nr:hypothetical protein [Thermoleophilia bacterium]
MTVLKGFVAQANESYRNAGLGEYQMKLDKHGNVTIPRGHARAVPSAGAAAPEQATAGAAATGTAPSAGAAPAATTADVKRSGAAPAISGLKPTADGFALEWKPVAGAKQYGVWQDGVLLGHVPSPKFAGAMAPGAGGVLQIDAVLANGTRTALTKAIRIGRDASGKLGVSDPSAAAAPATGTPSAAPATGTPSAAAAGAPPAAEPAAAAPAPASATAPAAAAS